MSNNNFTEMHLQWFADDTTTTTEPDLTQNIDGVKDDDGQNNGKLNIELIDKEATTNDEFKNKLLQLGFVKSFTDTQTSKGINTFKDNYDLKRREQLEIDVEKLHQDRYPSEDPKDKRIRQLEIDKEKDAEAIEIAQIAKHLSADASKKGIKLEEELIDAFAILGPEMGEKVLKEFAERRLNNIEEGKKKMLNRYASIPQTGDAVGSKIIPFKDIAVAVQDGRISEDEYKRRLETGK